MNKNSMKRKANIMEKNMLSYKEYKDKYKVYFEPGAEDAMKEVHGIDTNKEQENIIRQQYELYLKDEVVEQNSMQ